jgi:hypothetical protein
MKMHLFQIAPDALTTHKIALPVGNHPIIYCRLPTGSFIASMHPEANQYSNPEGVFLNSGQGLSIKYILNCKTIYLAGIKVISVNCDINNLNKNNNKTNLSNKITLNLNSQGRRHISTRELSKAEYQGHGIYYLPDSDENLYLGV